MKKTTTGSKTPKNATPPARKKLALKKDVLKDLTRARPGKVEAIKGGANYSRVVSTAF